MGTVVIGMDPHKRSATIEVMAGDETVLGRGRYGTDESGYRAMLRAVRHWPERTWAIEGCQGIGGHLARRLIADDEQVVDVPPRLPARTRVFATGQGRKTDATDAHSVALAATRMPGLRPVVADEQLAVLQVLADRRRSLGEDHTRMISQLHRLLLELVPGGAKKALSAAQARQLLTAVRPRDAAGKARRRVAAELVSDLERIYQRKKAADTELRELLQATGTTLTSLNGIGPSGAARLLIEAGDVARFPSKAHFASWNGTAPIDASSGDQVRHRLSRAGNRQINRVLHIMAVVQLRHRGSDGRGYYDRKVAAGKTPREAIRCLKRRLPPQGCPSGWPTPTASASTSKPPAAARPGASPGQPPRQIGGSLSPRPACAPTSPSPGRRSAGSAPNATSSAPGSASSSAPKSKDPARPS